MTILERAVQEAAFNAKESGYSFQTSQEMALDMAMYDSELERYDVDQIRIVIDNLNLL